MFHYRLFVGVLLSGFLWIHYTGQQLELLAQNATQTADVVHSYGVHRNAISGLEEDTLPVNYSVQHGVHKLLGISKKEVTSDISSQTICRKQQNVSFLKVHKAGSTTVMNIFLRFAISHQLNIVLPNKSSGFGFNYLGYGKTVARDAIVPLPGNETYNILCNHVVYNKSAFREILPDDTVYVGIIREPVSHFRSASIYYGFYQNIRSMIPNAEHPMSEFLKDPSSFNVAAYYVQNRMSFDFGVPKPQFYNDTFVDEYISELDMDYSLVMIMERFSESLVLLRRVLCWTTKDILFVPLNSQSHKTDFSLDEEDLKHLSQYNRADFKLYSHFNKKFDLLVNSLGQDLQDEVVSFTSIKNNVKDVCSRTNFHADGNVVVLHVKATRWSDSFDVTVRDCQLMTEAELPMMSRLIKNAWERYSMASQ